jgi:ubiquinol-cytochrome c reductase cytochrome b subunit
MAFGNGFHDFVLRFYTQHVFILPIVMLGLMAVHFPRFLVFDVPMVMAIGGAILITGGVFPVDLGFKFQPTVPPGITVPEWYLTGLYAFLRTQYDKFVTGVLWPGLFILSLLIIPFVDRYKKFSWKDKPLVTAFGIVGIAQILVTTYWGFYIPPDSTLPLVERLVIDPIYLYTVMILLVPLGIGFSYMMIYLAKEAERKAKLAKEKGPQKIARIEFSEKWINWVIIALIVFMVFLNIAAYNAAITGMKNMGLFLAGLILIVFAGMFHVYRYAMAQSPPPAPPPGLKNKIRSKAIGGTSTKELPNKDSLDDSPEKNLQEKEEFVKALEKKDVHVPEPQAPEIKSKSAGLDSEKDPNIGMSDLKKP